MPPESRRMPGATSTTPFPALVSPTPPSGRVAARYPDPSEVDPPFEVAADLGPGELVHGEPVPARRRERADRPVRDLERSLPLPPPGLQLRHRRRQVRHPVHEDRP